MASVLFFFCAECLELDLKQDPADEVLELEMVEGAGDVVTVLRLRPRSS